ncbi:MAG: hypothetical protein BWK79_16065 [Beggiatoa sp. IS2]|nr:MAG: hypothetical protein BWK79_16065 [Beggiatoa sp. IS2]
MSKHEHRLLGLTLITLHIALWWDFASWFSLIFLFTHLCLYVLWQSSWYRQELPSTKNLILLSIGIVAFTTLISFQLINIWLMMLWQLVMIGIIGGRDLVKPRDRLVNISAVIFLTLDLLIINIYQLLIIDGLTTFTLLGYGLLIIPIIFLLIPTDDGPEFRYHVDFFHGLTLALLIALIALGSLVIMYRVRISYPLAVFEVCLAMALFIFTISWLSTIFVQDGNIQQLWTRHLLSVGSTFDHWLENLAQPSNYKSLTPPQFLQVGFERLVTLPWVVGITWHSLHGEGVFGEIAKYHVVITVHSLEATVYSHYRISSGHYFQIRVLVQLLEYLHQAKRREEAFAQQAHLQAIYETGAKLTHDIKNILQSLHAITSIIETCQPQQFGETQRILQGQMPNLAHRLKQTLDKLQKPAEFSYSNVPVRLWWNGLQARYAKRDIDFFSDLDADNILVPEGLFDNVVENLLQNALNKRKREPQLQIEVTLTVRKRVLHLTVCDDGSTIPEDIAKNLLNQPIHSSHDGFGIGLYQAAKQVANTGYHLKIVENAVGQVCFELASAE